MVPVFLESSGEPGVVRVGQVLLEEPVQGGFDFPPLDLKSMRGDLVPSAVEVDAGPQHRGALAAESNRATAFDGFDLAAALEEVGVALLLGPGGHRIVGQKAVAGQGPLEIISENRLNDLMAPAEVDHIDRDGLVSVGGRAQGIRGLVRMPTLETAVAARASAVSTLN